MASIHLDMIDFPFPIAHTFYISIDVTKQKKNVIKSTPRETWFSKQWITKFNYNTQLCVHVFMIYRI